MKELDFKVLTDKESQSIRGGTDPDDAGVPGTVMCCSAFPKVK